MPAGWKAPTSPVRFKPGASLLLLDGCVLSQDDGTRHWWKLTPDITGQYAGGSWRRVASSFESPRYFAAAVLADGRVLVAGGSFSRGRPVDVGTAELYDPKLDQWTRIPAAPDGWPTIGNAPMCVLPNGKVLLGSISDNRCALFNPPADGWQVTVTNVDRTINSAGQTWTLLPDGSVLSLDCDARARARRYVTGQWIDVAAVPPGLVANGRTGPAVLLPDGNVLVVGATNATALFTPPGTLTPGPSLGQTQAGVPYVGRLGSACLLPNGRVLVTVAPQNALPATNVAVFLEYDPANRGFTALANLPTSFGPPEAGHMLLLPDGTVLYTNGTSIIQFYKPDPPSSAPDRAPKLADWPSELSPGGTGAIQGSWLSGLSQTCSSGAQAGPATNYPLVRLTATQPNGSVTYCLTEGLTPGGVATDLEQTASFALPGGLPPGPYQLAVVVNGIASPDYEHTILSTDADSTPRPEEEALQREMFWRELNEVHLLMDFVSGRADKSLSDMSGIPDPANPAELLKWHDAVQQVCNIRFPPVGSPASKARQAALLLSVKDKLNGLADPARGISVAFTSMFSGVAKTGKRDDKPKKDAHGPALISMISGKAKTEERKEDAYGFAVTAYPNLQRQAAKFRFWFGFLPWLALGWAFLTALMSWDVYTSSAALNTVTELENQESHLVQPGQIFFPTRVDCFGVTGGLDQATIKLTAGDPPEKAPLCRAFAVLELKLATARPQLAGFTDRHLMKHPVGWIMFMFSPKKNAMGQIDAPREQLAASVLSIFTNYIIPMMFGLLGTLAGLVRSVWQKVRDSTLRPEDARRTVASVPLGLVAGLSVGLIITPSGSAAQGVSNVAGSITLSATALAFLAGYGAEAFFTMIDELLKRVFSLGNASSGSKT
jgi:hypothetical protein